MFNIRTDLAIENREVYNKARKMQDDIEGVSTSVRESDGFSVTKVDITSLEGAQILDKPIRQVLYTRGRKFVSWNRRIK